MAVGILIPASTTNYISTPDHADFNFTDDFCVVAHIATNDWSPTTEDLAILSKFSTVTADSAWLFRLPTTSSGNLQAQISNGSAHISFISSVTVPSASGVSDGEDLWVAFTFDEDNGAGGSDVKFWYSSDGTSWSQLGSTQTSTTVTFANGTTPVTFARWGSSSGGDNGWDMTIYKGAIYSGIGANTAPGQGTLIAEFSAPHSGARYRDSTGKIWTLNGTTYSTVITA